MRNFTVVIEMPRAPGNVFTDTRVRVPVTAGDAGQARRHAESQYPQGRVQRVEG